jgi:hypothetical protein
MKFILFLTLLIVSATIIFFILYIFHTKSNSNNSNNNKSNKSNKSNNIKTNNNKTNNNKSNTSNNKIYKGLVLFDIDGTLTQNSSDVNFEIVQYCIDNNFAVGICTAGPIYNMNNLLTYNWMPQNLYDFIIKNSNITFNNVGSQVLIGKPNSSEYLKLPNKNPGYLKGFALETTAKAIGISNQKCMILCDDDKGFIRDALSYNKNLNIVCSGQNCGGFLSISTVKAAIANCK